MTSRRKKRDVKTLIIWGLLIVVAGETYFLLALLPFKKAVKPKSQRIVLAPPKPKAVKPVPQAVGEKTLSGRIAIIIDDAGYNRESCQSLKSVETPLAVAVLPWLEYSRLLAQCAHEDHKDVILHLPLEPHWNQERYPENYIIKTSMNRKRVEGMLSEALASVPFAVGVNNHMGSKATEDRRLMSIILSRLKERKLFFVDSLVTSQSVCTQLARKLGIDFAKRDVFLDNQNTRDYIEHQFAQLAKEARKKGYAIAIGHDRALTWQIVQEQTAILQKQGFKIVSVRELLE